MGQDTCQSLVLSFEEDTDILGAFGTVARFTGEGEVAFPVGAMPGATHDVLYL